MDTIKSHAPDAERTAGSLHRDGSDAASNRKALVGCPVCGGRGGEHHWLTKDWQKCYRCDGKGVVEKEQRPNTDISDRSALSHEHD